MADGKTAETTMTRQTTPFLLFLSPAISGIRSVQKVADGREEWHGAIALSYEVCRGITVLRTAKPRRLATPEMSLVLPLAGSHLPSFRYRFR